jgi:hypothetical protein
MESVFEHWDALKSHVLELVGYKNSTREFGGRLLTWITGGCKITSFCTKIHRQV